MSGGTVVHTVVGGEGSLGGEFAAGAEKRLGPGVLGDARGVAGREVI